MTAPALSRLMDEQPSRWDDQPSCHVPWCVRDDRDTGTHGSPVQHADRVSVILTAARDDKPYVVVGSVLALPPGDAPALASLLARLGHAELAALVTSAAALAGA